MKDLKNLMHKLFQINKKNTYYNKKCGQKTQTQITEGEKGKYKKYSVITKNKL